MCATISNVSDTKKIHLC